MSVLTSKCLSVGNVLKISAVCMHVCVCGAARCLMSEVTVRRGGGSSDPWQFSEGPRGPLLKCLKRQGTEKAISGAGQECESREATNPWCAVCYAGAGGESDSR